MTRRRKQPPPPVPSSAPELATAEEQAFRLKDLERHSDLRERVATLEKQAENFATREELAKHENRLIKWAGGIVVGAILMLLRVWQLIIPSSP